MQDPLGFHYRGGFQSDDYVQCADLSGCSNCEAGGACEEQRLTTYEPRPESAISIGVAEAVMQSAINAMLSAAAAAGVALETRSVREAMMRAVLAHPGDWASTWLLRFQVVAAEMQLQCFSGTQSIRNVLSLPRQSAPVIVYTLSEESSHRWLMLADRRLQKVLADFGVGEPAWKTPRSVIREMSLPDENAQVEFLSLQAAAPCASATRDPKHGHLAHEVPPLPRLLRLLRLDSRDVWTIAIFSVGVGILSLATPIAVELLVNTIAFGSLVQPVVILSFVLFTCLAFMVSMQLIQTYVVETLQRRVFVRTLADLSYRLPRVQPSAYDDRYGPELVNRFLDVAIFQKSLGSLLLDGLSIVLQAALGMIVLAAYHPYLLGFDVVMLATIMGIIFVLGRGATATAIDESVAKYEAAGWLQELARQPISIKMSGGPELAMSRADHLAKQYLSARSGHFRILMRQIVASFGLQVLSSTVLLGLGGWLVIQRELTLGQLVAAELIVGNIARSFAKFGKHFESYYDLLASTNKLGHLFDLPLERLSGEAFPAAGQAVSVKVSELEFAYPDGRDLFGSLNADILALDRVAVIGPSGSGKSTFLQLLYGLRTPSRGFIQFDGIDLRQLNLSALRSQIALVQQLDLMMGSILENVRWGRSRLTIADVNSALAAVGLLDTALRLPSGLDTQISPDGSPLSGGQARALTIARAIAGEPRLLLVDGALDELEGELLERVTATVFDPQAPWTLFLVTNHDEVRRRCVKSLRLQAGSAVIGPEIAS